MMGRHTKLHTNGHRFGYIDLSFIPVGPKGWGSRDGLSERKWQEALGRVHLQNCHPRHRAETQSNPNTERVLEGLYNGKVMF